MNKDEIDGLAKAASEIVKSVPVYQDTIQPVAKEVGKALKTIGGVINVALAPLAGLVYGYEKIGQELKERLERRLQSTPPENIISPSLQVVGPLLDRYKYCYQNDELSEMFVNLLANSMDKDRVKKAHPSFVNIISELSPDEAKLLRTIAGEEVLPKLDLQLKSNPADSGYTYLYVNFTLLGYKSNLAYQDLTPSYLANLERLRIITSPVGSMAETYADESHYNALEEHELIVAYKKAVEGKGTVELKKGIIRITDYGKLFIEAVVKQ